eukprot:jgi/Botrbrau1/4252/Bobra.0044s0047.1
MLVVLGCLTIVFVTLWCILAEKIRAAWIVRKISTPREGSLLGGHLGIMVRPSCHRWVQKWARQFGGIFRIRTLWEQVIVVADPFLYNELLQLERGGGVDKPGFSLTQNPNIFTDYSHSPLWRMVRKGVAPAFNSGTMKQYHHHVIAVVQSLIDGIKTLGPDNVVNMSDVAQRESFDVIGTVGFGIDFGTRNNITKAAAPSFAPDIDAFAAFSGGTAEAFRRFQNPLRPFFNFLPEVKKGEQDLKMMGTMGKLLMKEVQLRGTPSPTDRSIAAHLMRLEDPATRRPLPDARMAAEFSGFLLAGAETTGHTISWTLYKLMKHPEVLAKLEAELDAAGLLVTPERPVARSFTFADIQLPYLQAVVKESMRVQAVVAFGFRRVATCDLRLSNGMLIPKGMAIWGSNLASMTHPAYWGADSDSFVPERWLDEDMEYIVRDGKGRSPDKGGNSSLAAFNDNTEMAVSQERVRKFHPFGDGQRNCVGQNLARMNVPTAVAMFVSHFHLSLDESVAGKAIEDLEAMRITLQFKESLPVRCNPRIAS